MAQKETDKPVAVITGAGRREGIGFEVCRQLSARGMSVILTARDQQAAQARAGELRTAGFKVTGAALDVTQPESVSRLTELLERQFGKVDVLINNAAGINAFGTTSSTADLAEARAVMDVTAFGAWRVTQALLPLLRRSPGARVVNVSSGAGSHGDELFGLQTTNPMGPAYAVAKAALNALTVTFAKQLRPDGMLVNAVCPGFTATFPGGEKRGARPVGAGAASVV